MNTRKMLFTIIILVTISTLFLLCCSLSASSVTQADESVSLVDKNDARSYQHGVDFIKRSDGSYVLVWASSGNPPVGADENEEWLHDIYYSIIDPSSPSIKPIALISAPNAQEPVSSAIASNGHIMITMEDAWQAQNNLTQSYAIYDENLKPVKPYQSTVFDGGHSGHVSSVGNLFVVTYSTGWVDGGGVNNLGSGNDVQLNVYDSNGNLKNTKEVAVGDVTRDWWPLITGSDRYALLIWQRFVEGKSYSDLMFTVYNPTTNKWIKTANKITEGVKYYTYNAEYLDAIDRFLISGSYENGGGFSFLISTEGNIVAENKTLPPLVREAQPAVKVVGNSTVKVVYPIMPGGLAVLSVNDRNITLEDKIPVAYNWSYAGTGGVFLDETTMYFVSLSPTGIKDFHIKLNE